MAAIMAAIAVMPTGRKPYFQFFSNYFESLQATSYMALRHFVVYRLKIFYLAPCNVERSALLYLHDERNRNA